MLDMRRYQSAPPPLWMALFAVIGIYCIYYICYMHIYIDGMQWFLGIYIFRRRGVVPLEALNFTSGRITRIAFLTYCVCTI